MRFLNWFFVVVFILFAGLQYNDPDPYIWIPLYLYAAFLCWRASQKKWSPVAYWIGFVVYGTYAVYKAFDENGLIDWFKKHHSQNIAETMKAETPWVEESREFFGLVIIIVVMLFNYIYLSSIKKPIPKST